MKKLVIKTTLITLISTICALIITFGALCLFAPATVAGFFDGVGNYSASVFFYERQYEKSGDINDLDKLLVKVYGAKDYALSEKYSKMLIEHKHFDEFCQSKPASTVSNVEYYYGCYALSLAYNDNFSGAVTVGSEFVAEYGYTQYNPLRVLKTNYLTAQTTQEKTVLKDAISACANVSATQQTYKSADLIELG